MADSMLLLTVLAAGMAALATGVVVSKSASSSALPPSSGNTVSVLCLSSPESADAFRRVVESELDDTPRSAYELADGQKRWTPFQPADVPKETRVDRPGYRLVFRTVSPEGGDIGRRFASAFAETTLDHRSTATGKPFGGAVVDAAGLRAFAAHAQHSGGEHMPDFVIAVSPAPGAATFPDWCAAPADRSVSAAPVFDKAQLEGALRKAPRAVVLQGMETPYLPRLESAGDVTVIDVPGKGFHVFDQAACPAQKAGAAFAPKLTDAQYKDVRAERRAAEGDARELERFPAAPAALRAAAQILATRGRDLCGGYIRRAAAMCVSETPLAPTAVARLADAEDRAYERVADKYARDWGWRK